ncbi:MAG TPA: hypothetical protein VFM88_13375 [Vicinamibacteria bacterium]|nr:hypothetical protein [Vicinamibacteria bacterium]
MFGWLTRILSAIRRSLGLHDPNRAPMTPEHGWLLPDTSKPEAPAVPRR